MDKGTLCCQENFMPNRRISCGKDVANMFDFQASNKEIQILRDYKHPNLLHLIDYEVTRTPTGQQTLILMPYYPVLIAIVNFLIIRKELFKALSIQEDNKLSDKFSLQNVKS